MSTMILAMYCRTKKKTIHISATVQTQFEKIHAHMFTSDKTININMNMNINTYR